MAKVASNRVCTVVVPLAMYGSHVHLTRHVARQYEFLMSAKLPASSMGTIGESNDKVVSCFTRSQEPTLEYFAVGVLETMWVLETES